MKSRAVAILAIFVVAGFLGYWFAGRRQAPSHDVTVYYVRGDGESLGSWNVSLGKARDRTSVAFYATAQAVAGPPPSVEAVRFPAGTIVRAVRIDGTSALVDLGGAIARPQAGSLTETAEFKGLVYTLTALPRVTSVAVRIDGSRVASLAGGHFELDEPLTRASF